MKFLSSLTFPDDPEWVTSLIAVLARKPQPTESIPIPSLIEEIEQWLDQVRDESWRHKNNKNSLRKDFDAGVKLLGPALTKFLRPSLTALHKSLIRFCDTKIPTPEHINELKACIAATKEQMLTPEARAAAWKDVMDAARRSKNDTLRDALDGLGSMLEVADVPASETFRQASYLLNGVSLRSARSETETGPGDVGAEMSLDRRLARAQEFIEGLELFGHCVVWLTYTNAEISHGDYGRQKQPIMFYEMDWVVPNAEHEGGQDFFHRDELREILRDYGMVWRIPETERPYQVLARIDLGDLSAHRAIADAHALVEVLLRIAVGRSSGLLWNREGPAFLFVDGHLRGFSDRADLSAPPVREYDYIGRQATANALRHILPELGPSLAKGPVPRELSHAIRLFHEANEVRARKDALRLQRTIDERSALVLLDTAFDHLASFARCSTDDLDDAVMRDWSHARWSTRVVQAVDTIVYGSDPRARDLLGKITTYKDPGQSTSLLAIGREADNLLALCSDPLHRDQVEPWIRSINDGSLCLDLHEQLQRHADLLALRINRVRNGLVHGNPVHERSLDSVQHISYFRVNAALQVALEAFGTGTTVTALLDRDEQIRSARMDALRSGQSMSEIWAAAAPTL